MCCITAQSVHTPIHLHPAPLLTLPCHASPPPQVTAHDASLANLRAASAAESALLNSALAELSVHAAELDAAHRLADACTTASERHAAQLAQLAVHLADLDTRKVAAEEGVVTLQGEAVAAELRFEKLGAALGRRIAEVQRLEAQAGEAERDLAQVRERAESPEANHKVGRRSPNLTV